MDRKTIQLLNDLIESRLDQEQAKQLSELLRDKPEAARAYLRLLGIHLQMAESVAPVRPFSLEELKAMRAVDATFGGGDPDTGVEAAPAAPAEASRGRSAAADPSDLRRSQLWTLVLSLAAVVLLAVGVMNWGGALLDGGGDPKEAIAQGSVGVPGVELNPVVARITKKIDCDWEDDRWSVATSAEITAGQRINLSRGLLVLEFTSGAVVALNGPATLIPTSPLGAQLLDGTLSANVPPSGRGFKIETHAGQFIDLGTEFGMVVGDDGAVETHVFKGKVIAEPSGLANRRTEPVTLEGGAGWTRSGMNGVDSMIKARPERFLRPIIDGESEGLNQPPDVGKVGVWFNAESRVQQDQRGRVSAWGDSQCAGNPTSEDAWQVLGNKRPRYVADAMNGRPALRFNGYQSLVTEPMPLGANQSSAVVFRVNREAASRLVRRRRDYKHLGVQLLNLNGPPHTVVQINGDARLEARVHLAWLRNTKIPEDTGLLRSATPVSDGPHVAVYSYNSDQSTATLYLDGELISESADAPVVNSTTSPRYIGSHFDRDGFGFTGDIAEVLVYDSALSHDQSARLSAWMAEKYGIPGVEQPAAGQTEVQQESPPEEGSQE
ncbi:FecR protein [Posidoniimonas polymericola]|uniref:FecR protein n=1 Tax=Posidoniimonas polymericola TaxID=2528002 RepID=A0A5C5YR15_9BACT|nr:LamG-like jellyroll fold domain-containing protein [Posidoniimonas polymericola]TWT77258.1 FecR protein [Posidoniimonas polymericola]